MDGRRVVPAVVCYLHKSRFVVAGGDGADRLDSDVDLLVDLPRDIGLLGLGARLNWRRSSAPRST